MMKDAELNPNSFCHHCGNDLHHGKPHGHLRTYSEDLMEMGLHFDHRNTRSLPLLLWPGELPRRFNTPWKARYTPPLKIYIFIALIFFGLVFAKQHHADQDSASKINIEIEDGKDTASDKIDLDLPDSIVSGLFKNKIEVDREELKHRIERSGFISLMLSFPAVAAWLYLLYRRKEQGFWQHMAFVLYTHSSIFALASIVIGIGLLPFVKHPIPDNWALLGYSLFLLVALKRVYQDSWRKTCVKWGLLAFGYLLIVGMMIGLGFCAALLWTLIQVKH